ncbi:hypothetical protein [Rhizobium sp. Root149]|uniref:hypothetical protein n=1 Tax=Rhizobium sp. Root149 TaxID=1736473 RepID=UPI0012E34CB0|nr:hypothetical protein [Rhizobium sp. Root149]
MIQISMRAWHAKLHAPTLAREGGRDGVRNEIESGARGSRDRFDHGRREVRLLTHEEGRRDGVDDRRVVDARQGADDHRGADEGQRAGLHAVRDGGLPGLRAAVHVAHGLLVHSSLVHARAHARHGAGRSHGSGSRRHRRGSEEDREQRERAEDAMEQRDGLHSLILHDAGGVVKWASVVRRRAATSDSTEQ